MTNEATAMEIAAERNEQRADGNDERGDLDRREEPAARSAYGKATRPSAIIRMYNEVMEAM